MLERGPSIQKASVLQTRNGWSPISGNARLIPPPWSSSLSRSSETTIRGRSRWARCASIRSASQCTLTIAVSTPSAASRSRQWSISVRPLTSISGFGSVSVIGRMRWPRPAANTMAVFGIGALIVRSFLNAAAQGVGGSGSGPSARGRWF